jgi:hypothetical protein
MAEKYAKPGLMHRAATSPYVMTGFLKCGSCGANLVIVTGRTKGAHPKYGCPQNFYRGACTNSLKERADWLEDRLLSELQSAVMRPEVVDYALGEFERQLNASLEDVSNQIGRLRHSEAFELPASPGAAQGIDLCACRFIQPVGPVKNRRNTGTLRCVFPRQ